MLRDRWLRQAIWILLILTLSPSDLAQAQGGYDPSHQTQALLKDEADAVHLGNLARRANGVPPLRWNLQLTHAARWFAWDSTENRAPGFCGHQDTLGGWPGDRARRFGYLGGSGAENAFCGYVTPQYAIDGWMASPGHRANLLDPNSREVGLGYYRRASDGRGYVAQGFGSDASYAPVVIEDEAISTLSPTVDLYIYDRSLVGGFAGFAAATEMMVSNDPDFPGAAWEPYRANKAWTLTSGEGWREVYVKTRDLFNRKMTVSDAIYLGAAVPLNEIGAAQMSTTQPQVTLYNLNGGTLPQAQFSLGWLVDDTFGTFGKLWGNGERINDSAAWGGTAYRLYPGAGEASAWVWDTTFIKDTPFVAYIRLKVNDNTSSGEVARFSVDGGGTSYGPLSLHGTDFAAPDQYQEFALNFTFNTNPQDEFLIFQFWGSGSADVYVDAVTIFSAPQAYSSTMTWAVPGNNYRGQGVWVRYTNGTQFSPFFDAATTPGSDRNIYGNTGVGEATLSYIDGGPKTATSLPKGEYEIAVPYLWGGIVTPHHPCFAFTPANRSYDAISDDLAGQDYTPALDPGSGCADINVWIGGDYQGRFGILPQGSTRTSFLNVDSGPVKVFSTNAVPVIASMRVNMKRNPTYSSYTEFMGIPASKLSDTYLFPWYNNATFGGVQSQIRFGNVGTQPTTVTIKVGGVIRNTYDLAANESRRVTYNNLDAGPVEVHSSGNVPVIASMRINLKTMAAFSSYSEFMGLTASDTPGTKYMFPWYNNATAGGVQSQIRFGNVGSEPTTVTVKIGGQILDTYDLAPNASQRVTYSNIDAGPVEVYSSGNVPVIASMRVNLKTMPGYSSYSELIGQPGAVLTDTKYVFPWYNNATAGGVQSQLRFANVGTQPTTVTVKIGGQVQDTYDLAPNASQRVTYSNIDAGPVEVYSSGNVPIIASMRVNLKTMPGYSSYSELMGLSVGAPLGWPGDQLSSTYWFPWYSNATAGGVQSQLRFGVP